MIAEHVASLFMPQPGIAEHFSGLYYRQPGVAVRQADLRYADIAEHAAPIAYRSTANHVAALRYSDPGVAVHDAGLAYIYEAEHAAPLAFAGGAEHAAPLPMGVLAEGAHAAPMAYAGEADHAAPLRYSEVAAHVSGLGFDPSAVVEHAASLSILDANPGYRDHTAPMPILDAVPEDIATDVRVLLDGAVVPFVSVSVDRTQGQAFWNCDIELADMADYHRLPIRQAFAVEFGATTFEMIVDRRQFNQIADGAAPRPTIRGVSVSALYDAPFADTITKTWEEAIAASDLVAELLAGLSMSWSMVDWIIPGLRFAIEDMTPIAAASRVATAAGGVLESMPDGSMVARAAYPAFSCGVPVGAYDALLAARDDIHEVQEATDAARGVNSIRIYDTSPGTTLADRLEFTADEDDTLRGVVHAYPSPWRSNVRVRTSHGGVALQALSTQTRQIDDELIEIKGGVGSASLPIASIVSAAYETDNLGSVVFEPFTNEIKTGSAGYSLLRLSYTTRSIDYDAAASGELVAQMIMEEI